MEKLLKDRFEAGELLASRLFSYKDRADVVVLALPRGGVPVGYALAKKLGVALDIISVRKLGAPGDEELAIGAITTSGLCVMRAEMMEIIDISEEEIEAIAHREQLEAERREKLYRAGRGKLDLQDMVAIIVDDGLATGATMLTAIRAARQLHPKKIIVALPVAASDSRDEIEREVDVLVCLRFPKPFNSVGSWYENFTQTPDAEVVRLLTQSKQICRV